MDFLIITLGSHGDVHPFVGIARALVQKGHRVRLAANEAFGPMITNAGVEFLQLGSAQKLQEWTNNPDLWHPTKGAEVVFRGISQLMREMYEFTRDQTDAQTRVLGSSLSFGALIASEKHNLRYATGHLSPICVRTCEQMPGLGVAMDLNRLPMFMRRGFWWLADKLMIDRHLCPSLNELRRDLGLPPIRRVMHQWWNAPKLTLGLWPAWYSPKFSDFPEQVQLTGFPLYDESDQHELDSALTAWLAAGDAPIAFTPGSAMRFGHMFFESAIKACQTLGRRGILLTRHPEHIPTSLPDNIRHVPYAPFGQLLPHCSALVHHGGIGTTSQGLRAGIPQLIMPMSHDQPDNARICAHLCVGDSLLPKHFTPEKVAKKLNDLITNPTTQAACKQIAHQFAKDNPLARTVALLETL